MIFNSAEAKKAADFYVGLTKYSPKDYLNSNSYDGRLAFENGQVGMYIAGSWLAGTLPRSSPTSTVTGHRPAADGPAGCKTTIAGDALVIFNRRDTRRRLEVDRVPLEARQRRPRGPTSRRARCFPRSVPAESTRSGGQAGARGIRRADGLRRRARCRNPKCPRIETSLNTELGKAIYGDQTAAEALDNAAQRPRRSSPADDPRDRDPVEGAERWRRGSSAATGGRTRAPCRSRIRDEVGGSAPHTSSSLPASCSSRCSRSSHWSSRSTSRSTSGASSSPTSRSSGWTTTGT